eukprot:m.136531 g.136531  ORF g.136531 m.136531 type:complete len:323 (+) comp22630_c0_seq2:474-1442(+)
MVMPTQLATWKSRPNITIAKKITRMRLDTFATEYETGETELRYAKAEMVCTVLRTPAHASHCRAVFCCGQSRPSPVSSPAVDADSRLAPSTHHQTGPSPSSAISDVNKSNESVSISRCLSTPLTKTVCPAATITEASAERRPAKLNSNSVADAIITPTTMGTSDASTRSEKVCPRRSHENATENRGSVALTVWVYDSGTFARENCVESEDMSLSAASGVIQRIQPRRCNFFGRNDPISEYPRRTTTRTSSWNMLAVSGCGSVFIPFFKKTFEPTEDDHHIPSNPAVSSIDRDSALDIAVTAGERRDDKSDREKRRVAPFRHT